MAANAERKFIIEEILRGPGAFTDGGLINPYEQTGSRFEWDRINRASPRQTWDYSVKLRTIREEYPGSDEPVEQVLGPHFESFELSGVWDDRYAGIGFAENQRIEFEKMVRRGNRTRVSFEDIQFTGLITDLEITYDKKWRIGYKFRFSPHYRVVGDDTSRGKQFAPQVRDPVEPLMEASLIVQRALDRFLTSPSPGMVGTYNKDLLSVVRGWATKLNAIDSAIKQRVLIIPTSSDAPNSLSRVVASYRNLQASTHEVTVFTNPADALEGLFFQAAIPTLGFDEFTKQLAADARLLRVKCAKAAEDLERLFSPDAIVVYRPLRDESLYGISNRFYGTPHNWRLILERNNLHSITLTGMEVLIIPRVAS